MLTGPWIADNLKYNELDVKLLWQDVEGMVTEVDKFSENNKDEASSVGGGYFV